MNLSDSTLSGDENFQRLATFVENMNYHLLPYVIRVYYDTGDTGDMAIFAKEDGDVIYCFKPKDSGPLLLNYSDGKLRYFDESGGMVINFNNETVRFYGDWKPRSPTMGTCISNCYSKTINRFTGKLLDFKTIYNLLNQIKSVLNQIKSVLDLVDNPQIPIVDILSFAWDFVKSLKSCYDCYKAVEWEDIEDYCFKCVTFSDAANRGLYSLSVTLSRCHWDCLIDPWSHACTPGTTMKRCSAGSEEVAKDTRNVNDKYWGRVMLYECENGRWAFRNAVDCKDFYGPGGTCFEMPSAGGGPHDAYCGVWRGTPSGLAAPHVNPEYLVMESKILFAHDPNAKYVDKKAVKPGSWVNYTVEFENTGNGTAYGVYVEDRLSDYLNDSSLIIGAMYDYNGTLISQGTYDHATRTITWNVGEVPAKSGGRAIIRVKVQENITSPVEIVNFATVYFPSAFEITTTNETLTQVCVKPFQYILNNTCVNCTSDSDCMQGWFCNESYMCEKINSPPVAIADFKDTAFVNEEIEFNASKSYDPDGDKLIFFWSFGDGSVGVGNVATHSFNSPGTYNVTLSVFDSRNANNSTTKEITILSKQPQPTQMPAQTPTSATAVKSGGVIPVLTSPFYHSFVASKYLPKPGWLIIQVPEQHVNLTDLLILAFKFNRSVYVDVRFSKAIEPAEGVPMPQIDLYQLNEVVVVKRGTGEKIYPEQSYIKFRVEKLWLDSNDYGFRDVSMFRWNAEKGEWEKLDTEFLGSDTDYAYYKAHMSNFSLFAIGVKSKKEFIPPTPTPSVTITPATPIPSPTAPSESESETVIPKTTQSPEPWRIPGFEITYAMIGLLIGVYLLRGFQRE